MPFAGEASSEASVSLDLCFALVFAFDFSAFGVSAASWACSGSSVRLVFSALELVLQFFVQAEGLLPAFELLARQLGFLFVGAEIE